MILACLQYILKMALVQRCYSRDCSSGSSTACREHSCKPTIKVDLHTRFQSFTCPDGKCKQAAAAAAGTGSVSSSQDAAAKEQEAAAAAAAEEEGGSADEVEELSPACASSVPDARQRPEWYHQGGLPLAFVAHCGHVTLCLQARSSWCATAGTQVMTSTIYANQAVLAGVVASSMCVHWLV
jgi:hypothetical protein